MAHRIHGTPGRLLQDKHALEEPVHRVLRVRQAEMSEGVTKKQKAEIVSHSRGRNRVMGEKRHPQHDGQCRQQEHTGDCSRGEPPDKRNEGRSRQNHADQNYSQSQLDVIRQPESHGVLRGQKESEQVTLSGDILRSG